MIMYYQNSDNQKQSWREISDTQEDSVRQHDAFHMSIYKLSEPPPKDNSVPSKVLYSGDLWFDIDHKPSTDSPTANDYREASLRAIKDVQRLLSYFESINLNPKHCRLFATGGKGFHIGVDAKLVGSTTARLQLPYIHKFMADMIQQRAGTTGIDMMTYCCGQGKLLRVENKLRNNGKYKVPVTYEEILTMTPESYEQLTSSTRIETREIAAHRCEALSILYLEAVAAWETMDTIQFSAIPAENMAVFSDGNHPTCVNWIVDAVNIRQADGKFNNAKMSMSRYLMNAPLTNEGRTTLINDFATNWTSTSHPTVDSRRQALKETLTFGKEHGFACKLMTSVLTSSPCKGCKLNLIKIKEANEAAAIEITTEGYVRPAVGKGAPTLISNFTLVTTHYYIMTGDPANTFKALMCDIYQDGMKTGTIKLKSESWQSCAKFKESINSVTNVAWFGNDIDLQQIKLLLTNANILAGAEPVETIETIGICRHLDPERDIDEYVWVEENFSINTSGYIDTLKFEGKESKGDRTVKLRNVTGYDPTDEEQNKTLRALFKVNTTAVIAPVLGFMMGCWIRTHIRDNGSTDKHLPVLQMFGSSGHGKTETAALFAALAGADYMNHEPVVISSSTAFAIRCEASVSTTVPRIFDEMNEHRIIDKSKYMQAYEAVKMAARAGYMSSGDVRDKKLVLNNVPASSALIMLATQLNSSSEIEERTIPVSINRYDRTIEHTNTFLYVQNRFPHLVKIARTAMELTLHLDPQWAADCVAYNKSLIPKEIQDRIAVNWRFALVGLDYFTYILETKQTPKDIINSVLDLKQSLLDYLEEHKEEFSTQNATQEIDNVIDTFGEMVIQDNGYNKRFKHGEHYIVQGDTLHLWSAVFFPQYQKYCNQTLMRRPELSSPKQYQDLLKHQEYYLGSCPPEGVQSPAGWHSFHIPSLKLRKVRVDNFLV